MPAHNPTNTIPTHICTRCGSALDANTAIEAAALPKEGDISICFYCGYVARFAADLTVVDLPLNELLVDIAGPADLINLAVASRSMYFEWLERKGKH